MALHSVYCADVPLRNCSLTHSLWYSTDYNISCTTICILYNMGWSKDKI